MNMDADSWLTLAEVIRKSNLEEKEVQWLIKKLGKFLSPRNFGDIVKYPASAPDMLDFITKLRLQGWTMEDLKNFLTMDHQTIQEDFMAPRSDFWAELHQLLQEFAVLVNNLEIIINFGTLMAEALRSMTDIMKRFGSLIALMLDQERALAEVSLHRDAD